MRNILDIITGFLLVFLVLSIFLTSGISLVFYISNNLKQQEKVMTEAKEKEMLKFERKTEEGCYILESSKDMKNYKVGLGKLCDISIDEEVHAIYIEFLKGRVHRTEEIKVDENCKHNITFDYSKNGKLIGIEILKGEK